MSVVNAHLNDLPVKFSVFVNEGQDKLQTMYWLPKLHKRQYKARFIAKFSSCTTTELSKLFSVIVQAGLCGTWSETLKTGFLTSQLKLFPHFVQEKKLVGYSAPRDLHRRAANSICESCFLIHQDVYHDLFVCF